jgi:hypothetical protein
VAHALEHARWCRAEPEDNKWRVKGDDLDGDELTVIVVLEDGLIVVTVM